MQSTVVKVLLLLVAAHFTLCSLPTCGENEIYDVCSNDCYNTCSQPLRSCPRKCGPGACRCQVGFVREYEGGKCIRFNQCKRR